jgi:anti-sigma factor RsiW
MMCSRAEKLVDGYIDGTLSRERAAAFQDHAAGCARCAERARLARVVSESLRYAPAGKAPPGFAVRVMDGVYRQALKGSPRPEPSAGAHAPASRRAPAVVYRRLGLSFVLTAGVLAVSLLVPRVAYPSLLGAPGAGISHGSDSVVRGALTGAGDLVRGALGEKTSGGETR